MQTRWLARLLSAATLVALPMLAFAQEQPRPEGRPAENRSGGEREALFKSLDTNGDGEVSGDEVKEEQKQIVKRLDKNGDGKLTKEELLEGTKEEPRRREGQPGGPEGRRPEGGPNPEEAEAMFRRADANGDGKLVPDEVPEERRDGIRRMIESVDRNGDKALSLDEFRQGLAMLRAGQPGQPGQPGRPPYPPGAPGGGDALFRALDADGDGKISRDELYAAALNIKKLDRNHDGDITRDEVGPPQMAGGPQPGRPGEGFRPSSEMMIRQLDKDNDGKISKDEAPDRMKEHFARVDTNSDGFLDNAELGRMFANFRPGGQPGQPGQPGGEFLDRIRQALKDADKDGDGKLSKDEAPDRMKERFADIDKNGDGFIDADEQRQAFMAMMRNRGEGDQPRRRPEGERRPEGDRKPEGERRPDGERRPEADRKPEADKKPE